LYFTTPSGTPPFAPEQGLGFDGSSSVIGSSLTTVSSTKFLISCFINITGGDGVLSYILFSTGTRVYVQKTAANSIKVSLRNSSSTSLCVWDFSSSAAAGTGWHHILVYADGDTPGNSFGYFDGVANGSDSAGVAGTFHTDVALWAVGATSANGNKVTGQVSNLWAGDVPRVATTSDVSKFLKEGRPANLGQDGSLPFGTKPQFYLVGNKNNPGYNSGSSQDFGSITGTISDVSLPIKL
jgi:hypothetical protein